MPNILPLCDVIRRTSFSIHEYLRGGHLEKVYENALVHRLRKQGLNVQQQLPINIFDEDGTRLGHYVADLLIETELIVELKACETLTVEHVAQIFGYLRGAQLRHGLLINFGPRRLQLRKLIL